MNCDTDKRYFSPESYQNRQKNMLHEGRIQLELQCLGRSFEITF
jgi:hypothetical protein